MLMNAVFLVSTILYRTKLHVGSIESLPTEVKFPKEILHLIETARVVLIVKQNSECKCCTVLSTWLIGT
jgi:hypothetical protein